MGMEGKRDHMPYIGREFCVSEGKYTNKHMKMKRQLLDMEGKRDHVPYIGQECQVSERNILEMCKKYIRNL